MPIVGLGQLKRTLRLISRNVDRQVDRRMDNFASRLLGAAIAVSPELTRKLILSGRITKSSRPGRSIRVVSFDTPYAVIQHEGTFPAGPLTSRKTPTQDGEAGRKYLERPFLRLATRTITELGTVPLAVARRVRR